MAVVLSGGRKDGGADQGTERDYRVQHLDLPMGHLQLFVPSLKFRCEDGGVCDLVHLFNLEAYDSYTQLQPEELEDIECIQIDDFLEWRRTSYID